MNKTVTETINKAFPTKTSKLIGICTVYYLAKKIWKMEVLQNLYAYIKGLIKK